MLQSGRENKTYQTVNVEFELFVLVIIYNSIGIQHCRFHRFEYYILETGNKVEKTIKNTKRFQICGQFYNQF